MPRLSRNGKGGRSRLRRLADVVGVVLLLAGGAVAAVLLDEYSMREVAGPARVIDGDTIIIGGRKIRLAGIDAPELDQRCMAGGVSYACGERARTRLVDLLRKGEVVCRGSERDRYGRLLMRCLRGGEDVNSAMVLSGWAVAYGDYFGQERSARRQASGLWAGEFEAPNEWRAQRGAIADIGPAGLAARLLSRLVSLFGDPGEDESS